MIADMDNTVIGDTLKIGVSTERSVGETLQEVSYREDRGGVLAA